MISCVGLKSSIRECHGRQAITHSGHCFCATVLSLFALYAPLPFSTVEMLEGLFDERSHTPIQTDVKKTVVAIHELWSAEASNNTLACSDNCTSGT